MGGWGTVIVLLTGALWAYAYKISFSKDMHVPGSWTLPKGILNLYPPTEYYDLAVAESSKPLFNNIFWAPPIKLEGAIGLESEAAYSKINSKGTSISSNNLLDDLKESYPNNAIEKEEYNPSPKEYEKVRSTDHGVDEAALEKVAEARVEEEYYKQKDANRNRRENNDDDTNTGYQDSSQAKYAVGESNNVAEDPHGESSNYGHHTYAHYDEGDPHYEKYEPKKKTEIHYHQHKHLHEHDHLQEHKHQHLDEHQDKHYHEHKQRDDHKHYHEAKHEHKEKAEHYHKKYAEHKHEHYQDHHHDHKDEHWHKHEQEAWHKHKDKHEHYHKEDAKHYHEKIAKHGHRHHHKHEEEGKHHQNHWSEHKHEHNHHHDDKHYHDHKSDHYHKHKGHQKIRVHYKKHPKHR